MQFAADHKVTIDGITSGNDAIIINCPATIKNSTLNSSQSAVTTNGETAAITLQDCAISAATPIAGVDHSVTCVAGFEVIRYYGYSEITIVLIYFV